MTRPELYAAWIEAKANEALAIDRRRAIEDNIASALEVDPMLDGTISGDEDGFKVKVVGRLSHKVDAEVAISVAKGHDELIQYLESVFRWKPELAKKEWETAPDHVRSAFSRAITTTSGRPSITIERKE